MKPGKYLATTYSHRTYRPTTIGAEAFHFRVRNGTGWFRLALVTRGQSWGLRASARLLQNWDSGDFAEVDGGWLIVDGQMLLPINNQLSTINFFSLPLSDIHMEILLTFPDTDPSQAIFCLWTFTHRWQRFRWNQADRMISTGKLNMLPHLHFQPINVVVFDDPSGKTHLGRSLALRCFQRLSLPHLATQPCR
jgi:hypothetical protein